MLGLRRQSGEQGAVAILTAILAVAIIGFAAFAVDLGNAYARQRVVQNQADLAALAGAALLDGTASSASGAIAETLEYIEFNEVFGSDYSDSDLTDTDPSNGEVLVEGDYTRVRVIAPPATVDYGLAGVIGGSSQDVQAQAVASIFSPAGALAPFFIAEGCVTPGGGKLELKTDPGNVDPTPITPAYFPFPSSPGGSWPSLIGVSPFELIPNQSGETIDILGDNLADVVEVGFTWTTDLADAVTVEVVADDIVLGTGSDPDVVTVTVPDEVVELVPAPFDQEKVIWIQVRPDGSTDWSPPLADATVLVPLPGADLPDECGEKSTGDFGLIESPRDGSTTLKDTQQNVAEGLDHGVVPYPPGAYATARAHLIAQGVDPYPDGGADICDKQTASPPLVKDIAANVPVDGFGNRPNCFEIYTGNKVPVLDAGLIEGGAGFDGRLDAPASDACGRTKSVTLNSAWTINDDLLSCYIRGDQRVIDVLTVGATDVIESTILQSPRFMFVPVIHSDYPPQNGSYPIVDYRGAMISDEQATSTRSNPQPLPDNGIIISKKKIGNMTVTYFELDALPEIVSTPGDVIEYLGTGPKVVRLVE